MKTVHHTFTRFEKGVALVVMTIVVVNFAGWLINQADDFCVLAGLAMLLVYFLLVVRLIRANISFTYEQRTGDGEPPRRMPTVPPSARGPHTVDPGSSAPPVGVGDASPADRDPLGMHPSHDPYHSARLGGRLCKACGVQEGMRRAFLPCAEMPPTPHEPMSR